MFRYRTDRFEVVVAIVAGLAAACVSCGLVDLRPVTVATRPAEAYTTLASRVDCLAVDFSAEPLRLEAERAFMVSSPGGAVEGDFIWNANGFSWKPVSPWDPGVRYRLVFRGSVRMADGREAFPEFDLPFYALRSSGRPGLVASIPEDGASTVVSSGDAVVLQLVFSEAMDAGSVEDAFVLRPSTECRFSWNAGNTTLDVTSEESLSPCTAYRWTIGTEARAADGSPLASSESGSFSTDIDTTPPRVERVYPVVRSGGDWVEVAADLSGVDAGHSIAILFSETVDAASVASAVRIEPSQPGTSMAVSPRLVVHTPDRDWIPEKPLTLVVSENVEDASGLRMQAEFRARFTPAVPFLRLLRVSGAVGEESTGAFSGDAETLAVTVGAAPEGVLVLTLGFSVPFGSAEKTAATERISLTAFFPGLLPAPRLRDAFWLSDDTVSMSWEGLRRSDLSSIKYYRLVIPGGQGGITASSGLWMAEDASILLEAKE